MKLSKRFLKITSCSDCGLLLRYSEVSNETVAYCCRCRAKLFTNDSDTTNRTLALSLTCFVLFILVNVYPFLIVHIEGIVQETRMITGIAQLYSQGMPLLALIVMLTAIIFPLLQILGLIYLLLPMKLGYIPKRAAFVFRVLCHLKPWGMMVIYMLGLLIALIKLTKMATIVPGLGAFAFILLILFLTTSLSGLNPQHIWQKLPVKPEAPKKEYRGIPFL